MELNISGNKVVVKGNVKSIENYKDIRNAIESIISTNKSVIIELINSISLTSSVIGYLSKLVNMDGITVELYVGDEGLYELLDDLGLISLFKVKKLK